MKEKCESWQKIRNESPGGLFEIHFYSLVIFQLSSTTVSNLHERKKETDVPSIRFLFSLSCWESTFVSEGHMLIPKRRLEDEKTMDGKFSSSPSAQPSLVPSLYPKKVRCDFWIQTWEYPSRGLQKLSSEREGWRRLPCDSRVISASVSGRYEIAWILHRIVCLSLLFSFLYKLKPPRQCKEKVEKDRIFEHSSLWPLGSFRITVVMSRRYPPKGHQEIPELTKRRQW